MPWRDGEFWRIMIFVIVILFLAWVLPSVTW
jgi:hypothetical protein